MSKREAGLRSRSLRPALAGTLLHLGPVALDEAALPYWAGLGCVDLGLVAMK